MKGAPGGGVIHMCDNTSYSNKQHENKLHHASSVVRNIIYHSNYSSFGCTRHSHSCTSIDPCNANRDTNRATTACQHQTWLHFRCIRFGKSPANDFGLITPIYNVYEKYFVDNDSEDDGILFQ